MDRDYLSGFQDDLFGASMMTEGGTMLLDAPVQIVPLESIPAWTSREVDPTSLSMEEKIARALDAIDRVMSGGHPIAPAYSAGKDSSVMLALVIEAARLRVEAGKPVPLILVTHANTGIENPAMQTVANAEIQRIKNYAAKHNLPVRIDVATPALNDSWAVRIISGRALPTFANSSVRDCSINWKIQPQERQRKNVLKELNQLGAPVVMTGTRFEESTSRASRMTERGETDAEIWEQEVRSKDGKIIRTELRMSPIAHWDQGDVWTFLSELTSGARESYTDAKQVWETYQDGGNSSCAVVSDDTMKANAKACGARFGCSLCTSVGRDKSLEAMLEADPKYRYMVHLNRLQRFLVDSQYDIDRRQWVGRSISDDGFIAIGPDSYSPAMQRDLLRYALTIDAEERIASSRLGVSPRFSLVDDRQLIAIDAIWSLQGSHDRPFEAIHIWEDVTINGNRYFPPVLNPKDFVKKFPAPKYLFVGRNWDDDPGWDNVYTGARSLMADLTGASDHGGCMSNVTLSDGRIIMDAERSAFFEVDADGAEDFLSFEALDERIHVRCEKDGTGEAFRHYQMLGTFSTSKRHLSAQDEMLRRSAWKDRHGVHDMSREDLLARSVTKAEREAGMRAPEGHTTLPEDLQVQLEGERQARKAKVAAFHASMGW